MTLNDLASAMWERLGFQGMDASVLSKVLKGERIFNVKQLQVFCEILKLNRNDQQQLMLSLEESLLERFGFQHSLLLSDEWLDDMINKIQQVRLKGSVELANEWCEQLLPQFSLNSRRSSLELFARLLREHMYCIGEAVSPNIGCNLMRKQASTLIDISHQLKDENLFKLSQYHLGNASYGVKEYRQALEHIKLGLSAKMTNMEKAITLNAALIASAAQASTDDFNYFKKQAQEIGAQCESFAATTMYGGLARAEAMVGNASESLKNFEMAETHNEININKRGPQGVLKSIQLHRTQLEIATRNVGVFGINTLKKIGDEAIDLAKQFGYLRYQEQVVTLLRGLV